MSRRRGLATLLLVAALALAVAGCGGGPGGLSTSGYEREGVEALKPLLTALGSLKSDPVSASGWAAVQKASRSASDSFDRIRPPTAFASLNSDLSDSLDAMSKAAGKLRADISNQDTAAATADAASYRAALQRYGNTINDLGKKGVKFSGS